MSSLCLNEYIISTPLHDTSPLESFAKVVKDVKFNPKWIYYKHPFTWHISFRILWKMRSGFTIVITYDYQIRHLFMIVATHKVWKSAKFEKKLWNKRCMIHGYHEIWGTIKNCLKQETSIHEWGYEVLINTFCN